jgi:hypothetical protein
MEASVSVRPFSDSPLEEGEEWFWRGREKREAGEESECLQCMKQSSDAGYSWGEVAYAEYFRGKDADLFLRLLKKSGKQNNPKAYHLMGEHYFERGDRVVAEKCFYVAAKLGWRKSAAKIVEYPKSDLVRVAKFAAPLTHAKLSFWDALTLALSAVSRQKSGVYEKDEKLSHKIALAIGEGLFWYKYGGEEWAQQDSRTQSYGERCLEYYITVIELQQKSIFLFLDFWNQTMKVKDVGQIIAKMVWEDRYEFMAKFSMMDEWQEESSCKLM